MSFSICIFEDEKVGRFFPLTRTRGVYDLRCGIHQLKEKIWREFPASKVYLRCRDYLTEVVRQQNPGIAVNESIQGDCLFINGRLLQVPGKLTRLNRERECLLSRNGDIVAVYLKAGHPAAPDEAEFPGTLAEHLKTIERVEVDATLVSYPWELVNSNAREIERDFEFLAAGGQIKGAVSEHAALVNKQAIYIGNHSSIQAGAILDASEGPIYIGDNVTVMCNAVIQGPAFVGNQSKIKMAAKIYEGTSIGEVCKVGGEVEESIIHSYSNKQHDGFLGHAYLGQWVNLGADTNNSDLKNNYGTVKVYVQGKLVDSGSQFAGLFMGDHSKSGINTMFNTGTSVGVMCNVFGAGFPPKYIPSFSWGGGQSFVEHQLEKALATARVVMSRRNVTLSPGDESMLRHVFEQTRRERQKFLRTEI